MSHSGLLLPRPARTGTSTLPEPPPPRRVPPPNFSNYHEAVRAGARALRQSAVRSPFVKNNSSGKERDLSGCSLDELTEMLERNTKLLDSPHITSALPGGDTRIRSHQARIVARLKELEDVQQIKTDLDRTHLDENGLPPSALEDTQMDENTKASTSPRTKQRLIERTETSPNGLMGTMSLAESLERQRVAAAREREAALRHAEQLEIDSRRPKATGELLRGAMKGVPKMSGFLFQNDQDDSDEEDGEDVLDDGDQSEVDDMAELNPLRQAYMEGYHRAEKELVGG